jgi:hypothetical protein
LRGIGSDQSWGKASDALIRALYEPATLAVVATDRKSAHLAVQLANKIQLPVLAISDDTSLTSANIPWVFRLPSRTPPREALQLLLDAARQTQTNREDIRRVLASGTPLKGKLRFESTGEPVPVEAEPPTRSY